MKVALVVLFSISYLFATLRSIANNVTIGEAMLGGTMAVVSAACLMILAYLR